MPLLLSVIGLSNSGIALLAPNQQNPDQGHQRPGADHHPFFYKYSPEYTCMLVGAKWLG